MSLVMAEAFHPKSTRRILGILMGRVKEGEVTNSETRKRISGIEYMMCF